MAFFIFASKTDKKNVPNSLFVPPASETQTITAC